MLVVDLMHEFELGVWKTLFIHLIRVLYAFAGGSDRLVVELDRRFASTPFYRIPSNPLYRYRQISTFGHGTIRKFAANSSEMKKMAARDFEDLLQVFLEASISLITFFSNNSICSVLFQYLKDYLKGYIIVDS